MILTFPSNALFVAQEFKPWTESAMMYISLHLQTHSSSLPRKHNVNRPKSNYNYQNSSGINSDINISLLWRLYKFR